MAIKSKDIKLLWGKAGGRCSFPGCNMPLSVDKETVAETFPLGEQAHIVGEKTTAPRGHSILNQEERDSYANLILLCPTHHTLVDKNINDWPVEKLHIIKTQHELMVERAIGRDEKNNSREIPKVYADHIEYAVQLCNLDCWIWFIAGLTKYRPIMQEDQFDHLDEYAKRVGRAVLPNTHSRLEASILRLAKASYKLYQIFGAHSYLMDDNCMHGVHFYKERTPRESFYNQNYDRDLEEYNKWRADLHFCIVDMTKAANWFADEVRSAFYPEFFADSGKFVSHYDNIEPCEYSENEKQIMMGKKERWKSISWVFTAIKHIRSKPRS